MSNALICLPHPFYLTEQRVQLVCCSNSLQVPPPPRPPQSGGCGSLHFEVKTAEHDEGLFLARKMNTVKISHFN